MAKTISKRLELVMEKGDLTIGDLRHWFERPYPTVHVWRYQGNEPTGPTGRLALQRLRLLEKAVERKRGPFPVPLDLSKFERPTYIKKARHDLENGGVSKSHPA